MLHTRRSLLAGLAGVCAGGLSGAWGQALPVDPGALLAHVTYYLDQEYLSGESPANTMTGVMAARLAREWGGGGGLVPKKRNLEALGYYDELREAVDPPPDLQVPPREGDAFFLAPAYDLLRVMVDHEARDKRPLSNLDFLYAPATGPDKCLTKFLLLMKKGPKPSVLTERIHSLNNQSDGRTAIQVDRAGCGELAEQWLKNVVQVKTGVQLSNPALSELRNSVYFSTAKSSHHSVLALYFDEIKACVVTAQGWDEACAANPNIKTTVEVVLASEPMAGVVVACGYIPENRKTKYRKALSNSRSIVATHGVYDYSLYPLPQEGLAAVKSIVEWQRDHGPRPAQPAAGAGLETGPRPAVLTTRPPSQMRRKGSWTEEIPEPVR